MTPDKGTAPDKGMTPDKGTPAAAYPGTGDVKALDLLLMPNGQLLHALWRGTAGYSQTVPMKNGAPDWSSASAWSGPVPLTTLSGSGDGQALSSFVMPSGQLLQSIWRGNEGFSRTVPIANGAPDWSNPGPWSNPVPLSILPGSGDMNALDTLLMPNGQLLVAFWRGNDGYSHTVPMKADGTPDWSNPSPWSTAIPLATLPGAGDPQALASFAMPGQLLQRVWRGNQGFSRTVPITNGTPDWSNAGAWSGPILP